MTNDLLFKLNSFCIPVLCVIVLLQADIVFFFLPIADCQSILFFNLLNAVGQFFFFFLDRLVRLKYYS